MRIGLILFIGLMVASTSVYACECCKDSLSAQEYFEKADVVFIGIATEEADNWIAGGKKFTFVVEDAWKQALNKVIYVSTPFSHQCGSRFNIGEKYVVHVMKKKGKYSTDCCMGNTDTHIDELKLQFGKGLGLQISSNADALMIGVSVTLLIVLVVFIFFVHSYRSKS